MDLGYDDDVCAASSHAEIYVFRYLLIDSNRYSDVFAWKITLTQLIHYQISKQFIFFQL